MSRIDPIRRQPPARRVSASRAEPQDAPDGAEVIRLPVVVEPTFHAPPPRDRPRGAGAPFAAHILGQGGERRGLKSGPAAIQAAQAAYNGVEWSGARDRRARKGRLAREEV